MSKKNIHNYFNFIFTVIIILVFSLGFGFLGAHIYTENNESIVQDSIEESVKEEIKVKDIDFKSQEDLVVKAVKNVSPSVVSIMASRDVPKMQEFGFPFEDPFFRDFFGDRYEIESQPEDDTSKQEISAGSGFIVSKDGYIVTNKHVVLYEDVDYTVVLNNEESYEATVVDRDTITDLAILKIDADNLPAVNLGDSANLEVGQTTIAIGNALGEFSNTVSTGVISGLSRTVLAGGGGNTEKLTNVIQTDASINPGNSGGPLLNIAGEVIGINTAMASGAQNIGFAISINEVKSAINSVYDSGKIVRPWLGVRYIIINERIAKQNNLKQDYGALIIRASREELAVIPGSPADKAGLKENDIILEVNGKKVNNKQPLSYLISKHSPGETINLKVKSQGEEKNISLILEERS